MHLSTSSAETWVFLGWACTFSGALSSDWFLDFSWWGWKREERDSWSWQGKKENSMLGNSMLKDLDSLDGSYYQWWFWGWQNLTFHFLSRSQFLAKQTLSPSHILFLRWPLLFSRSGNFEGASMIYRGTWRTFSTSPLGHVHSLLSLWFAWIYPFCLNSQQGVGIGRRGLRLSQAFLLPGWPSWLEFSIRIWGHSYCCYQRAFLGTSLVVQWLRFCPSNAGGMSSIPGWGTKILHAKKKKKKFFLLSS